MEDDGGKEWMCIICGFDNKPLNKFCSMCGTDHHFTLDYKEKKNYKKNLIKRKKLQRKMMLAKAKADNADSEDAFGDQTNSIVIDIPIAEDAHIRPSIGITEQLSRGSSNTLSFSHQQRMSALSPQQRQAAINYRRLNQLSLRQKSARRRKMWQRVKDPQTNKLVWKRVPINEIKVASAPFGYTPRTSMSEGDKSESALSLNGLSFQSNLFAENSVGNNKSTLNLLHVNELLAATSSPYTSPPSTPTPLQTEYNTYSNSKIGAKGKLKRTTSGDSFGDSAFASHSPGFASVFDERGNLKWEKIESGKSASRFVMPIKGINLFKTKSTSSIQNPLLQPINYHGSANSSTIDPESRSRVHSSDPNNNYSENQSLDGSEGYDISHLFDLEAVAAMTFKQKHMWFLDQLATVVRPWVEGFIKIEIRRDHILADSYRAFMMLSPVDLKKWIRIQFRGEEGVDAGGLVREWFELVVEEIFKPSVGLFESNNPGDSLAGTYHINAVSGSINPQHLSYFRFIGRFIGKAILEQQTIKAALSLPLRKQMLSVPITFSDLEFVDEQLYNNLVWLKNNSNVADLQLDHTVTYAFEGHVETYDLLPGGADILVTDDNKENYLQLRLRHRMLDAIKGQLEEFLTGFYEVVPNYITVFDYQELELLLCGLTDIDYEDWLRHTEYLGSYKQLGEEHPVITWFWATVKAMSMEERVRLLQFTTGCSRLPAHGFKGLQSNDGKYRKFNIQSIPKSVSLEVPIVTSSFTNFCLF